ncbi:MAG: hypothetical protein LLG04_13690 [Parachlamydia sp.]|nr:hypothetical protein [Parachlamydia sp.]
MSERPSQRELHKKIEEAKAALESGRCLFANPAKAVGELYALEMDDSSGVWPLIRALLNEIEPDDYAGSRPPQRAYEVLIAERELFAFSWNSGKLNKKMYLKFALKDRCYYYVSLHPSQEEG